MFSIRMAMRQVKRIRQLVRNVKPIAYPASSILFAYSIFFNKPKKAKELEQGPHEPLNLKHKPSLEHIKNSIAADAVRNTLKTYTITFEQMLRLNVKYRILLEKLISVHKEFLSGDISDMSDAKRDLMLELRNETQVITRQLLDIENYMIYIEFFMNAALKLNAVCQTRNTTAERQMNEMQLKLRKEFKKISHLELEYWNLREQCIKKAKNTSDLKWFNVLIFQADDLRCVNFSKE